MQIEINIFRDVNAQPNFTNFILIQNKKLMKADIKA